MVINNYYYYYYYYKHILVMFMGQVLELLKSNSNPHSHRNLQILNFIINIYILKNYSTQVINKFSKNSANQKNKKMI